MASIHTKRRKRHRANAILKNGTSAVRKHKRIAGRTGSIWAKRMKARACTASSTREA